MSTFPIRRPGDGDGDAAAGRSGDTGPIDGAPGTTVRVRATIPPETGPGPARRRTLHGTDARTTSPAQPGPGAPGPSRRRNVQDDDARSVTSDCIIRRTSLRFTTQNDPEAWDAESSSSSSSNEDDDGGGEDGDDDAPDGMEAMDLRATGHDDHDQDGRSVVSFMTTDSDLQSGLFQAASGDDCSGGNRNTAPWANLGVGGGHAPHYDNARPGGALSPDWAGGANPQGERDRAYRELMQLMQRDPWANYAADGGNKNISNDNEGDRASERDGSGFFSSWSAMAQPHNKNPQPQNRRRLYVNRCLRAMAVFVVLAALSITAIYIVAEDDFDKLFNMLPDNLIGALSENEREEEEERRLPQGNGGYIDVMAAMPFHTERIGAEARYELSPQERIRLATIQNARREPKVVLAEWELALVRRGGTGRNLIEGYLRAREQDRQDYWASLGEMLWVHGEPLSTQGSTR